MKISILKDMDKKTVKGTTAQARRKNLLIQGNDISNHFQCKVQHALDTVQHACSGMVFTTLDWKYHSP